MSKVAVVKGERSLETVYKALDLTPYREAFNDWDRVLIKVNFITTKDWRSGATTDPMVVEALVHRLRELGKEVVIVESDAQTTNADKAWVASGMDELGKRLDVPFINLRHVDEKVEVPVKNGRELKKMAASEDPKEHLHASLALLADDHQHVEYVRDRMLSAPPDQVEILRKQLVNHKSEIAEALWKAVEQPAVDQQEQTLQAASALALFDPGSKRWQKAGIADRVVVALVKEPASRAIVWIQMLKPAIYTTSAPFRPHGSCSGASTQPLPKRPYSAQPNSKSQIHSPANARDMPILQQIVPTWPQAES